MFPHVRIGSDGPRFPVTWPVQLIMLLSSSFLFLQNNSKENKSKSSERIQAKEKKGNNKAPKVTGNKTAEKTPPVQNDTVTAPQLKKVSAGTQCRDPGPNSIELLNHRKQLSTTKLCLPE